MIILTREGGEFAGELLMGLHEQQPLQRVNVKEKLTAFRSERVDAENTKAPGDSRRA